MSFTIDRILSVDHAFGQLELYVFGQDWPKAIRSTGNSVDKGPTRFSYLTCQNIWRFLGYFEEGSHFNLKLPEYDVNFAKYFSNHQEIAKLYIFCQNDEVLPNLVTLNQTHATRNATH